MQITAITRFFRPAVMCLAVVLGAVFITGCSPSMLGVIGMGVSEIALDRRTLGRNLDDKTLTLRVYDALTQAPEMENARFTITTHNGVVLLTGEIEQEADRRRLEAIVISQGATTLLDRLIVAEQPGIFDRANDLRIEAQIKAQLTLDLDSPSTAVQLVSERGRVYLLGLVTKAEARAIVKVVQTVHGVQHIVMAFEYIEE